MAKQKRGSRLAVVLLIAVSFVLLAMAPVAAASFGLKKGSVKALIAPELGTSYIQAGGHPDRVTVEFKLRTVINTNDDPNYGLPISDESPLRNVNVEVPPGLVGDPTATPRCTLAELKGTPNKPEPECSDAAQIGVAANDVDYIGTQQTFISPVYNMVPEPGQPALFGFSVAGTVIVMIVPELRTNGDYGLNMRVSNVDQSLPVTASRVTFWGIPTSDSNDDERGKANSSDGTQKCADGTQADECLTDAAVKPFLRLPTNCSGGPQIFNVAVEAWGGQTSSEAAAARNPGGEVVEISRCDRVPFEPSISGGPTTDSAGTASGFDFTMSIPEAGIKNPDGIGQGDLKKAVVKMPLGVTINPSSAEGLGTCSLAQYQSETLKSVDGAGCPNASKLGTVKVETPLLEKGEALQGSLFLAQPDDKATAAPGSENPFDSLLALYLVARLPERGLYLKLAGKISLDPKTGQVTTTFDNLPQLPFTNFTLHLREGARAPLVSAPTCGPQTTEAELTPWSAAAGEAAQVSSTLVTVHGVGGGACPGAGLAPFHPGLIAGSINSTAGAFSPFYVRLLRNDEEQEITNYSIKLPPGLVAKLAGVPFCPDEAIAAAKGRTGAEELALPACPAASEIGHTLVGVGVGSILTYTTGKVYLAGPYHGSPISIVAVNAAKVGPFDVGTVVVREALEINPETAEVFVDATGSDPIPHIVEGVVLHLRDLRIYVDRPQFALNPTSCKPTSTASTVLGSGLDFVSEADNNPITVSTRYQASDCAALGFKPKLSLSLRGSTRRSGVPALRAVLKAHPGDANISRTEVVLPRSEFLQQSHIRTVCTRVQFSAGAGNGAGCPAGAIYGRARAVTPLLDEPLEGPVFLRSNGGERSLPDLVAALHGQRIDIDLVGFIDAVKEKNGRGEVFSRIRNRFVSVPDAPVSKFVLEMQGGKKGLLVNSTDLCRAKPRASVKFSAHNGRVESLSPPLQTKCRR